MKTDNRKLMQLRRMLRGQENFIEITIQNNLNGVLFYKNNDVKFELKNKGDITFLTLAETKQIPRTYFEKRWIYIVDVYTDNTDLTLSLEDIYDYLQISQHYNYTDNTLLFNDDITYKDVINTFSTTELENYLKKLDTVSKREFTEVVTELYRNNELTNAKTLRTIENNIDALYFEDIE